MANVSTANDEITDDLDVDEELKRIDQQLNNISKQIVHLNKLKERLIKRKDILNDVSISRKSKHLGDDSDWNSTDFEWYDKVTEILNNKFHLTSFRPFQLSTINATLSKKDVILIMPTGGGKSLCFQLPALIDKGFTLVVSPMLSLMEDQVMNLKSLSINAEMMSSQISKENDARISQMMINSTSGLKLLYVTPEKLAKSKRFMSKLQKAYELGLLSRVAVDEVHCSSEWGHDFRPDYQFLMALRGMLEKVPFIGLTATATSKVILDVQKMLSMIDCIVFKASFNRPNLYYEVRPKSSNQKECIDQLEELIRFTFKDQSGIIYTATVKDCEDLREELRKRGCRVNGYHAQLDAALRLKIHKKWLTGEYQVIIATIAFGLGIDKPDVRFVIHYSLSKSMENFYQESGRAGRDGKQSKCIVFYRFGDVFKLSTMVFTQKVGLKNLYSIVDYCLNRNKCRRKLIASHFDEQWESTDCNNMCDNCRCSGSSKLVDIRKHCESIRKILQTAFEKDVKVTAQMVVDVWFNKGGAKFKCKDITPPTFSREMGEKIMAYLLINGYLKEDFHYTAYSTISYIKEGSKCNLIESNTQMTMWVAENSRSGIAEKPIQKINRKRKASSSSDD